MKKHILKVIALLAILMTSGEALAALPPRGLVLYTQPPGDYALNLEFVTLTYTNIAYATVTLPNGKKEEIPRGGIVAVINYPPEVQTDSLPQDAATATQIIKNARSKYPQFGAKLDAVLAKWTNSLEVYHQKQRLAPHTPLKPPVGLSLEVDGTAYTQVVMTSFDGTTVGITHEAGAARIPAVKLNAGQIAALNATSTAVRIDPSKITVAAPAPVSTPNATKPAVRFDALSAKQFTEDRPVVPKNLLGTNSDPSFEETLDFINRKLKDSGRRIWFGERTQKMILLSGDQVVVFDPGAFNAEVRFRTNKGQPYQYSDIEFEVTTGRDEVQFVSLDGKIEKGKKLFLKWDDNLDPTELKRLATAFSHLIVLFGGKRDAF